jgi:hypothetical protein
VAGLVLRIVIAAQKSKPLSQAVADGYFKDHGTLVMAEAPVRRPRLGDQLGKLVLFEIWRQPAADAVDRRLGIGWISIPRHAGAPGENPLSPDTLREDFPLAEREQFACLFKATAGDQRVFI